MPNGVKLVMLEDVEMPGKSHGAHAEGFGEAQRAPPPMVILQSGVGAWYSSLYRVDMSEQVQANADP
jgi:hypothetical protein